MCVCVCVCVCVRVSYPRHLRQISLATEVEWLAWSDDGKWGCAYQTEKNTRVRVATDVISTTA